MPGLFIASPSRFDWQDFGDWQLECPSIQARHKFQMTFLELGQTNFEIVVDVHLEEYATSVLVKKSFNDLKIKHVCKHVH